MSDSSRAESTALTSDRADHSTRTNQAQGRGNKMSVWLEVVEVWMILPSYIQHESGWREQTGQ